MQYITLVSDSYEKAVEEAKRKYGSSLRIISRKEYTSGGGIFTRKRRKCEITFYLVEEKPAKEEKKKNVTRQDLAEFEQEARTPDPETLTSKERLDTLKPARDLEKADSCADKAAKILDKNEIGMSLRSHILDGFDSGDDLSLAICDKIISSVMIDHENQAHPRKYQVFLGPTGSGKTTTLAKIASLYKTVGKNVGIITLDSYRIGAYEQIKAFADAFSIPVMLVRGEDEIILAKDQFRSLDLVLVDTMGLSPADAALNLKLRGLLSLFGESETSYLLTCPATTRTEDMLRIYRHYAQFKKISSLIVTKLDETGSIGPFLTFAYEVKLPVSFCTNGQGVPDDLMKASTLSLTEYLTGLDMELKPVNDQLS